MMKSVWMALQQPVEFGRLTGRVEVDVAVVGGGIAGVTAALLLSEAGSRVALLEADTIGAGNTGRSTGNLYGTVSQGLQTLREKWDADAVREVVNLRLQAIDFIERTVHRFGIECGFARRRLHACVAGNNAQKLAQLEQEFQAMAEAGLSPERCEPAELPIRAERALRVEQQAQFNPYLYAVALANALSQRGVHVFERSAVTDIDASKGCVRTTDGEARARDIVIATHSPIGFNLVQAQMQPFTEYGISARLRGGTYPEGIFWVRDAQRSIRSYRHGDDEYLVVVGETHKTGESEAGVDYPQRLRDYASRQFDVASFEHEWSAQQFRSADGLPYIGASAHRNVFIATGFAADGLTWGTVAGSVLMELIRGHDTRAGKLLTPRRFTPIKSARVWAEENVTVVKHFVGDRLEAAEADALSDVAPGSGRIVELDGRKHAVYRASDGTVTVLAPVCTHLKCLVSWNTDSHSWDCPCHGSRFGPRGDVLAGPAIHPLERQEVRESP